MLAMWQLAWPVFAFLATTAVTLGLGALVLGGLRRWARPGGLEPVLDSVRMPAVLWAVVVGLYMAVEVAGLPPRLVGPLRLILEAAIIVSVTMTLARVLGSLIARASERQALGGAVTGLAQTAVRLSVLLIGLLVLLGALGIQITPILTALGVGGLAVALGLQDTLSNLFAGIHLLADKPIRVGHYVRIGDVEGVVTDIGWRSTRLRSPQSNTVVLPNKKVAESVITNYDLPEASTGVAIQVNVGYGADPDRVEAVLLEEARGAVGAVPGLLDMPAPGVVLAGFGEYALRFTLLCHVARFADGGRIQHELRKRVLRRFRAEGIEIPRAPSA